MIKHSYSVKVYYKDIDQMGIVYYSRYFEYFEEARTEMLASIGLKYSEVEAQGYRMPVIEAYSESAEGLIKKENMRLWFPTKIIELEYPYNIEKPLSNLFAKFNVNLISQNYNDLIYCVIELNIIDIDVFLNTLTSFSSCSIKKS